VKEDATGVVLRKGLMWVGQEGRSKSDLGDLHSNDLHSRLVSFRFVFLPPARIFMINSHPTLSISIYARLYTELFLHLVLYIKE